LRAVLQAKTLASVFFPDATLPADSVGFRPLTLRLLAIAI
jgi:hypothetical protein